MNGHGAIGRIGRIGSTDTTGAMRMITRKCPPGGPFQHIARLPQ